MIKTSRTRTHVAALSVILVASAAGVSAHVVRGLWSPTAATAFASSPTSGTDAPIPLTWAAGTNVVATGFTVACFNVANTSAARIDRPEWPRITSVGLELPGSPSGFALVAPLDGDWDLVEGRRAFLPGHGAVTLDLAIVARIKPSTWWFPPVDLRGIPPGQQGVRGAGTRFCVSGPFPSHLPDLTTVEPDDMVITTIEGLLNGVVVGFHGVDGNPAGLDAGVWADARRVIPLYPE